MVTLLDIFDIWSRNNFLTLYTDQEKQYFHILF